MSRHAAATTAGRTRTAPTLPRRVSGPAAPNRRDAEGSRDGAPGRDAQRGQGAEGRRAAAGARRDAQRGQGAEGRRAAAGARRDAQRGQGAAGRQAPAGWRGEAVLERRVAPRSFAAPRPVRLAYGGVAIASRVAGVAVDVSASRAMDRLVRSRVWIGVVAFFLIGLVATQVSLLKLNSGIGRAVQAAGTLERSNAALRAEISRLSAGERIQRLAAGRGFVMPAPSDVRYLRAGDATNDAARAARRMHAPDPNAPLGLAGAATQAPPAVVGGAPAGATAPAASDLGESPPQAASTPGSTTSVTPSTATGAPGGSAAAPTGATSSGAPASPATAAATGAPSGGASPQATTTAAP